jgi:hypothetical protein
LADPGNNQGVPPGAVADAGVPNLDDILRRLGDDQRRDDEEADALRDQARQLQDALNALAQANRDRDALLNDKNNNDDALADALRALGQDNQEQPIIPPPVTPPQIAAGDQGRGDQQPLPQPEGSPPLEPSPQMPFFPQIGAQPSIPPAPQIVVGGNDKNKNGLEEFLLQELQRERKALTAVSEAEIARRSMQDLIALNREQLQRMQPWGPYGPRPMPGGNNILARLRGQGGMPMPMAARRPGINPRILGGAAARQGQLGTMGLNSAARSQTVPASVRRSSLKR